MGLAQNCWHYSYLKNFIVWSLVLTLVQANSDHVSLLLFLLFTNCSPDPTTNSETTNSNVHNDSTRNRVVWNIREQVIRILCFGIDWSDGKDNYFRIRETNSCIRYFGTIHLRCQHVLGGEGCPHGPMVKRSLYIKIKNPRLLRNLKKPALLLNKKC